MRGFGFDLAYRVFQLMDLAPDIMEMLVIVYGKEFLPFHLEIVNFQLKIRFGVDNSFAEVRMRLFDTKDGCEFIQQPFFILAVNSFDLRKFEGFLPQLQDGHLFESFPFHKETSALS